MTYATETRAFNLNLAERIGTLRAALAERIQRNRMYRQTLNELSMMTPRELSDIGINASMIKAIALEAAYGTK